MVKRYSIEGELIYPKDDGHIVRYDDYEILQQKFDGVSRLCEEAMLINCDWEKVMMAAIGEDGIGSVTKAIEQLKADKQALQQKLDAMAAENAALKTFINQSCYSYDGDGSDVSDSYVSASQSPFFPKNPATDTYLNSVRAEGVDSFQDWLRNSADIFDKNGRHEWADKNRVAADKAKEFAEQLRSGSHDTAREGE